MKNELTNASSFPRLIEDSTNTPLLEDTSLMIL